MQSKGRFQLNTPRFFTAALLLTVILGAMACGPGRACSHSNRCGGYGHTFTTTYSDSNSIVVEVTATPSPRPTRTPIPTIILPTATPMPPVSINSDCVGCPVVVPGAWGNQQVLGAYFEWSGASKHPGKVLLVTCSRGDNVYSLGEIMGARGVRHVAQRYCGQRSRSRLQRNMLRYHRSLRWPPGCLY